MTSDEPRPGATHVPSPAGNLPTLLLCLMVLLGFASAWGTIRHKSAPVDFYQFWVVGQVMTRPDVANIYSEADRNRIGEEFLERAQRADDPGRVTVAQFRRKLEAVYSPFFYTCFRAGSTGDYATDLRNYRLLLMGCFALAIVVFSRLTGHSWVATGWMLILFSVWYDPFYSDLAVGNVNGLQLAMLAAYVWMVSRLQWKWRDILGGAWLGLAVMFKPTLVFVGAMLVVDWIIRRQGRRLGMHAAGAVLGMILAFLIGGAGFHSLHCWTDWVSGLRTLPAEAYRAGNGNHAPSRIISERLDVNASLPLVLVYGGLAVAGTWRRRREISSGKESDAFSNALPVATGCLLLLLTAPLAWVHYFVLAVPAFLLLLSPVAARRPTIRSTFGQQILVLLAFLCFTVNVMDGLGLKFSSAAWSVLNLVGMSVLFLLAVFSPARSGEVKTATR